MKLLFLLFLGLSLYGNNSNDKLAPFIKAQSYFNEQEYEKALPILLQCIEKSKKPEAAYKRAR